MHQTTVRFGAELWGALEAAAAAGGARAVRLETNRSLHEAISLYRTSGYAEVPAFNDERYAHHWFKKTWTANPRGLSSSTRRDKRRPHLKRRPAVLPPMAPFYSDVRCSAEP